ncbi:MAG: CAP domain-containing protein [Rhodothermaceae bacterium]|nr:CAP domain-containing protein [Rhodothermaceae bacterium]
MRYGSYVLVGLVLLASMACVLPLADDPPDYDEEHLERLVLEAVNRTRRSRGLRAFALDRRLTEAARAHSRDLAQWGRTGHSGSNGSTPAERIRQTGWVAHQLAENIYRGSLYAYVTRTIETGQPVHEEYHWETPERLARLAVDGWMSSPGHRTNMLDPDLQMAGLGVAFDAEHRWVVTLDMASN